MFTKFPFSFTGTVYGHLSKLLHHHSFSFLISKITIMKLLAEYLQGEIELKIVGCEALDGSNS